MKPFDSKVYLSSPTMHGDELRYVTEAYETNWMSTVGANISELERMAAEKVGCKYAVALSCGTAALHLAIKLAGVQPGDKVFCSDILLQIVCYKRPVIILMMWLQHLILSWKSKW